VSHFTAVGLGVATISDMTASAGKMRTERIGDVPTRDDEMMAAAQRIAFVMMFLRFMLISCGE